VADHNALIHAGDRSRDLAIGLGVASGVTLLTTIVLGYVSYRLTGEVGPFRL